ncbi:LamB/YcsF family protein [Cellulomonas sp. HZM]|uniref:LamB/YcsF family protein n=1 Tax=Cellulomonas sp. HZM TaxID=1454010 RepID=UPI000492F43E|nr:5-oxoprolinase subunit PxpA [Cellulomonas sp. HZM]
MAAIDLNCDLGEEIDPWAPGEPGLDSHLLTIVTSANVACGAHAGDERIMSEVCREASARGVAVGAHVSYVDRAGFGRTFVDVPADTLREQVAVQIATLRRAAATVGAEVRYVKPHGALYNAIVRHEEHALAVVEAVEPTGLPVVGLPASAVLRIAREHGLRAVTEAFADRGYRADGTLVPRSQSGALVTDGDEVADRVLRIALDGRVRAVDGTDVAIDAESVCVHSDTPGAAALAAAVRARLESAGVDVRPFAAV